MHGEAHVMLPNTRLKLSAPVPNECCCGLELGADRLRL
jgi:hypothetical protein